MHIFLNKKIIFPKRMIMLMINRMMIYISTYKEYVYITKKGQNQLLTLDIITSLNAPYMYHTHLSFHEKRQHYWMYRMNV